MIWLAFVPLVSGWALLHREISRPGSNTVIDRSIALRLMVSKLTEQQKQFIVAMRSLGTSLNIVAEVITQAMQGVAESVRTAGYARSRRDDLDDEREDGRGAP